MRVIDKIYTRNIEITVEDPENIRDKVWNSNDKDPDCLGYYLKGVYRYHNKPIETSEPSRNTGKRRELEETRF